MNHDNFVGKVQTFLFVYFLKSANFQRNFCPAAPKRAQTALLVWCLLSLSLFCSRPVTGQEQSKIDAFGRPEPLL